MNIKLLEINEIDAIVEPFDSYRQRYKQPSEPERIREYLKQQISNDSCKMFVAYENEQPLGFALLYPSFSSIGLAPIWYLNDFYVFAGESKSEIAKTLLDAAKTLCKDTGAIRIEVTTRKENHKLHNLYKNFGFEKDYKYDYYFLRVAKDDGASNLLK